MRKNIIWKVRGASPSGKLTIDELTYFFHKKENAYACFNNCCEYYVELSYIDEDLIEHFILTKRMNKKEKNKKNKQHIVWNDEI